MLAKVALFVETNKKALITKGLPILGFVVGTVVVGIVDGIRKNRAEGIVDPGPDADDSFIPAEETNSSIE